jgi:chromosome partitioning protein
MPVVVVANPKGGVGKSTLACQIAGGWARQGHAVMLGDADRQLSAQTWLSVRPPQLPAVSGWEVGQGGQVKTPPGTTHLVLDTPAGLSGRRLAALLDRADKLLVPLQPSLFDIHATHPFLAEVRAHPRAAQIDIGIVAMRVREGSLSADQLTRFLETLDVPVVATLRDTQTYVQLTAHGLSLWDVAASRVERDLQQWAPLQRWLDG